MDAIDPHLTAFDCHAIPAARETLQGWLVQPAARKLLSIIVPVRNEEGNLRRAYDEVSATMADLPYEYEVLLIDNASTDRSGLLAAEICTHDERWRYVRFSRDFGLEASLAAGFRLARGDAAIVLFGDLQDPPEMIGQFLEKWDEGHDVVYGVIRRRTGDPFWKAKLAWLFYRTANYLADSDVPLHATDFRLLSRRAIDAINQFDERNRYIRGYSHWIGLKQCPLVYDRRPRVAEKSKAPFFYLLNYGVNAITCFSIKPLQLFSVFGLVTMALTAALAVFYLSRFALGLSLPGFPTTYLLLLANLGVMLFGFGTVGEYVGRIYLETKRRPLYIIDHAINMPAQLPAADVRPMTMSFDTMPPVSVSKAA